jgi:hypothetical protein
MDTPPHDIGTTAPCLAHDLPPGTGNTPGVLDWLWELLR